jgi:hypothetical protein
MLCEKQKPEVISMCREETHRGQQKEQAVVILLLAVLLSLLVYMRSDSLRVDHSPYRLFHLILYDAVNRNKVSIR